MRSLGMPDSTALVMPPSASTSSMSSHACVGERCGERLDVVAAAERVDDVGDAGLLGEDQLGVAGDARREVGRQRERLVEASWCGGSACRRAPRPAPRRVVRTMLLYGSCSVSDTPDVWQCVRSISDAGFFGSNCAHDPRPEQARRAQLRDLHEEVHADAEEEREAAGERVDVEAAVRSRRARTRGRRRS